MKTLLLLITGSYISILFLLNTKNVMAEPKTSVPEIALQSGNSTELLARAPVRRWDGLFTVRLNVTIGNKTLNGRFLVDPKFPASIMSPVWLESQGILPLWIERTSPASKHKAKTGVVNAVELSGTLITALSFLIRSTDIFVPPEVVEPCCNGVLGTDFLKKHIVEFTMDPELKLWNPAEFHPSLDDFQNVSLLVSDDGKLKTEEINWNSKVPPVLYNALTGHGGTNRLPRRYHYNDGDNSNNSNNGDNSEKSSQQKGGATISPAAPLPYGSLIFDIPHGRLWFSKSLFDLPAFTNHSGLKVGFVNKKEHRRLEVLKIDQKSPAKYLLKEGLRPGTVIDQIASKNTEEMDSWEVDQLLGGSQGKTITIAWTTRHKLITKTFSLK